MHNSPSTDPEPALPGLTFVVPAYNVEPYLEECIASILRQRECDLHVIIVDDGSTDASGMIADRLAEEDPRIKVLHKPNGGLSDARNHALPYITTPYVSFVDADDALSPNFTATLLPLMKLRGVDLAVGGHVSDTEYPWTNPNAAPKAEENEQPLIIDSGVALRKSFYQQTLTSSAWGRIYRREIVQRELYTKGILYEDLDIFHRYCRHIHKVAVISTPIYFYRENPMSILHTFDARRLDVLKVTRDLAETYGADPYLGPASRDRRFAANFNMLLLCAVHDPQGYSRTMRRCWDIIRRYRFEVLLNKRSRLKNRLGALLSYLGPRIATAIGSRFYLHN